MSNLYKNQKAQQNFVRNLEPVTTMRRITRQNKNPQSFEDMPFVDLTGIGSYHDALNINNEIKRRFHELPSNIRSHFMNDPHLLYHALEDPNQQEKLYELGIKKRPVRARNKKGDINVANDKESPPREDNGSKKE